MGAVSSWVPGSVSRLVSKILTPGEVPKEKMLHFSHTIEMLIKPCYTDPC